MNGYGLIYKIDYDYVRHSWLDCSLCFNQKANAVIWLLKMKDPKGGQARCCEQCFLKFLPVIPCETNSARVKWSQLTALTKRATAVMKRLGDA